MKSSADSISNWEPFSGRLAVAILPSGPLVLKVKGVVVRRARHEERRRDQRRAYTIPKIPAHPPPPAVTALSNPGVGVRGTGRRQDGSKRDARRVKRVMSEICSTAETAWVRGCKGR